MQCSVSLQCSTLLTTIYSRTCVLFASQNACGALVEAAALNYGIQSSASSVLNHCAWTAPKIDQDLHLNGLLKGSILAFLFFFYGNRDNYLNKTICN